MEGEGIMQDIKDNPQLLKNITDCFQAVKDDQERAHSNPIEREALTYSDEIIEEVKRLLRGLIVNKTIDGYSRTRMRKMLRELND